MEVDEGHGRGVSFCPHPPRIGHPTRRQKTEKQVKARRLTSWGAAALMLTAVGCGSSSGGGTAGKGGGLGGAAGLGGTSGTAGTTGSGGALGAARAGRA